MMRLLRELDGIDAAELTRPRPAPGHWTRRFVAAGLAVMLTVTVAGLFAHKHYGLTVSRAGVQLAAPLGQPPPVPDSGGSFAYLATQGDGESPVAYDPCDPIEYVVNDAMAPPGAADLLESAVSEISAATGLVFRHLGSSSDLPSDKSWNDYARSAPVLIAWTTPEVLDDLSGRVAGIGGSTAVEDEYTGRLQYRTGMVALDARQLTDVVRRPDGRPDVQAIIMHELAHLVGLDHVDDPGELMFADNVGRTDFGPGDRRGLAALGSGRCFH